MPMAPRRSSPSPVPTCTRSCTCTLNVRSRPLMCCPLRRARSRCRCLRLLREGLLCGPSLFDAAGVLRSASEPLPDPPFSNGFSASRRPKVFGFGGRSCQIRSGIQRVGPGTRIASLDWSCVKTRSSATSRAESERASCTAVVSISGDQLCGYPPRSSSSPGSVESSHRRTPLASARNARRSPSPGAGLLSYEAWSGPT